MIMLVSSLVSFNSCQIEFCNKKSFAFLPPNVGSYYSEVSNGLHSKVACKYDKISIGYNLHLIT